MAATLPLADALAAQTREGELYERYHGTWTRCFACGHRCPIPDGASGVCKVRFNRGGRLMVPWGYVAGAHCDPIEKKPFFHAWPGSLAYSFGMLGCDLHCGYCQNWVTSQALRDPNALLHSETASARQLTGEALKWGARTLVSTYNEPLITAEWGVAVFKEARAAGLATACVSNGNGTPEVLEYLRPWVDLWKVDLKGFDEHRYRQLGGRLQPVLDTIASLHGSGIWLEIVTLLVPGFNDSDEELRHLTGFIADVSRAIPWHVTAFHTDYRMDTTPRTSRAALHRAATIGGEAGLQFVYVGNLLQAGDLENTRCPECREVLIERSGFLVRRYGLTAAGCCPSCGTAVPGRWA